MKIKQLIPIGLILCAMVTVYFFDLNQYLSFESLKENRKLLSAWTENHFLLMSLAYSITYIFAVALSVPGAVFLTLAGGFLFGTIWGSILVIMSASLGSVLLFLIVKYAIADIFRRRTANWLSKMKAGFNHDAFNYLLILRLIPLFPFWVVNIVPALLDVKLRTYFFATFWGIMPASIVFVTLGNGLGHVFDQGKIPDVTILLQAPLLIPLCGLAVLALIPVLYKKYIRYHSKG